MAVFSNYIAIFVRADGAPNRAMAGVLLGGAALASVLGIVIQAAVVISHRFSKKNELKFIKPKHIFSSIGQIIVNGIPSFFNELANGFIVLLFNIQILKYCGDRALSIYSVISEPADIVLPAIRSERQKIIVHLAPLQYHSEQPCDTHIPPLIRRKQPLESYAHCRGHSAVRQHYILKNIEIR